MKYKFNKSSPGCFSCGLIGFDSFDKKSPSKNFLIVDAGMNDLIRPPLYSAYHAIKEVSQTKNKKIPNNIQVIFSLLCIPFQKK